MRIAIISDIHGNYTALDAVLSDIRQQAVNGIICLGDVATIGPRPQQVIKMLREMRLACILGNHDAALLDLERAPIYQVALPLIPTLHWCAQQRQADFDFLLTINKALPNKACSGRVGFVDIFKHFSGFEFFLLPNIFHTRPSATNAKLRALDKKTTINIQSEYDTIFG